MLRKTIPTVCSNDIFDAPFDFAELCGGHPMLTRVACIRWLFWPRKRLLAGCDSIFFAALLPSRCLCLCWLTGSMAGWLAVLGQTLCFGWRIFRFLVARARCKLIFVAVCLPCRRLVTAGTQACGRFSPFLCLFFFCASFPYAAAAFAAFVAAAAAAADWWCQWLAEEASLSPPEGQVCALLPSIRGASTP